MLLQQQQWMMGDFHLCHNQKVQCLSTEEDNTERSFSSSNAERTKQTLLES